MSMHCNLVDVAKRYKISPNKLFELSYDEGVTFFVQLYKNGLVIEKIKEKRNNFLTNKELTEILNGNYISKNHEKLLRERSISDYFFFNSELLEVEKIALLIRDDKAENHWESKRKAIIELAKFCLHILKDEPTQIMRVSQGKKVLNASAIANWIDLHKEENPLTKNFSRGLSYKKVSEVVSKAIKNGELSL